MANFGSEQSKEQHFALVPAAWEARKFLVKTVGDRTVAVVVADTKAVVAGIDYSDK